MHDKVTCNFKQAIFRGKSDSKFEKEYSTAQFCYDIISMISEALLHLSNGFRSSALNYSFRIPSMYFGFLKISYPLTKSA